MNLDCVGIFYRCGPWREEKKHNMEDSGLVKALLNIKVCIRILRVAESGLDSDDSGTQSSSSTSTREDGNSSSHYCASSVGLTLVRNYAECVVRRFIEKEMLSLDGDAHQNNCDEVVIPHHQQDATQPIPTE